ncbi:MAG TPA: AI-2E family transporter [Gammaproteobacteria bacterium]|nr:AI-2E family transporter [Gammaproteobacteria bacterium]
MQPDTEQIRQCLSRELMDVFIRVGLVALLVVVSASLFAPFAGILLWALILAVTLYPLHRRLAAWLGGRPGPAATVLVLAGLLVIGLPTLMLGASLASQAQDSLQTVRSGGFAVPPPDESVARIPLVGEKLLALWQRAAEDLPGLLHQVKPQLQTLARSLLVRVASAVGDVLMFIAALAIAGIMMAWGESGSATSLRIMNRLAGPGRGRRLFRLSTATIRSVATGVIGVAFIQALLLGLGFLWADIPATGVLAILVFVIGLLQLPAAIVTFPVIAYIWWSQDTAGLNTLYTVYLLVAGMADSILKPLLLGRGVDAPMPIILLGALGGMMASGLLGLFLGAVLLALGYRLFMDWVDEGTPAQSSS